MSLGWQVLYRSRQYCSEALCGSCGYPHRPNIPRNRVGNYRCGWRELTIITVVVENPRHGLSGVRGTLRRWYVELPEDVLVLTLTSIGPKVEGLLDFLRSRSATWTSEDKCMHMLYLKWRLGLGGITRSAWSTNTAVWSVLRGGGEISLRWMDAKRGSRNLNLQHCKYERHGHKHY